MTVSSFEVWLVRYVIDGGTRSLLIWLTVRKLKFFVCGEKMVKKYNLTSFIQKR